MCIEFLEDGNNEEFVINLLCKTIFEYFKLGIPTEDELETFLLEQVKLGNINKIVENDCNYKLTKIPEGHRVLLSKSNCESGKLYDIMITETEYKYKTITHSNEPNYDDIVYREFNEDLLKIKK